MKNNLYRKILVLFFLSGATALIYQVVWTRLLTLAFGSTILAVSTVLTVFMGGLAIGSAIFGRKADTVKNPVRVYAFLELLIGLLAIATPLIFHGIETLYISVHQSMNFSFWQSAVVRFGLSLLMLLPPTVLMGGTLPLLSKVFLNEKSDNTRKALSVLYFINTAGAVTGTLLAGLFLLQMLGIKLLLISGGVINIGIFIFAYRMGAQPGITKLAPSPSPTAGTPGKAAWSRDAVLAALALSLSGMAALIYEVAWTRVLTLVIGSSTYAFTVMLATFLAGIAMGSAFVGRLSDNRKSGMALLAVCQVLIGVFALVTAGMFGLLPDAFVYLFGQVGDNFNVFLASKFLLCFIVMIPATIFMGASFPVACSIVVEAFGSSGRRIGYIYAGNTVGAILGAFLAGFILLPTIGIQQTILLTIFINLITGLLLSINIIARQKKTGLLSSALPVTSLGLIIVLAFIWQPEWDRQKMTSGPYAYASQYQNKSIDERFSNIEQLYYKEGPIATVSVIKEGKHVRLAVDGKTDAGNYRDMVTQVLLGHLPLIIKPDAKDVLVIGFASGITTGAVSRHDVDSIDCVEIEPAMKEASSFFEKENYSIMDDDRFNLIIDDGRSYVTTTKKKYDIVISEPSNPWQSGSSRLFTKEAFVNARKILKENGLMVQWMHLYGTSVESVRLVARTFMSVFPHTTMWMDPVYADIILIGSFDELKFDPLSINRLYKNNTGVKASMSRIGYYEDWSIMKAFVLGENELRNFAGEGNFNTDNLPLLEYRAPKALYSQSTVEDNIKAFLDNKSPEYFLPIVVSENNNTQAANLLSDWGVSLAKSKSLSNAKGALLKASELNPSDYSIYLQLGYLRMSTRDYKNAIRAYEKAADLNPEGSSAYANLGALYYQTGKINDAYGHFKKAISLGEDSSHIRNSIAVILAKKGEIKEAVKEARKAVMLNPDDETAANNLNAFNKMLENQI